MFFMMNNLPIFAHISGGRTSGMMGRLMMPNGKTIGGNCRGCFWHSEYQHVQLLKNDPEHFSLLEKMEEKFGHTFNEKYSYKELRENYEAGFRDMLDEQYEQEFYCTNTYGSCGG
jgi:hypothetical protein